MKTIINNLTYLKHPIDKTNVEGKSQIHMSSSKTKSSKSVKTYKDCSKFFTDID